MITHARLIAQINHILSQAQKAGFDSPQFIPSESDSLFFMLSKPVPAEVKKHFDRVAEEMVLRQMALEQWESWEKANPEFERPSLEELETQIKALLESKPSIPEAAILPVQCK